MRATVRAIDDGNNGGYKMRRAWDIKTILVVIAALSGGGATGLGVKFYNTNEVNQTPARIEILKERMNAYISSHAREESLSNQLIEQKLLSIKADLLDLKDGSKIVDRKLDDLTRLIRNGGTN